MLAALIAGCAAPVGEAPSLAPRPAEAIDPRAPVPDVIVSPDTSPALPEQLDRLVAQAVAADEEFRSASAAAERLVEAAGPPQSESWIAAQQALSAAAAAREPVTRALAEIDAIGAAKIQQSGGIGPADLAAINAAAERVAEIDARQAALLEQLQARLQP